MELGYFAMPSHPPECGLKEGQDWDLQVLRWLDELGYQEAWIGEHHTAPWEPHPSPDLLVAQALLRVFVDGSVRSSTQKTERTLFSDRLRPWATEQPAKNILICC